VDSQAGWPLPLEKFPLSLSASRPYEVRQFPPGVLWGAATSSHQIKGKNRWNDGWADEQSGRLPHMSGEACRHYQLYAHDFDLACSWGHNAHRFPIEWSRIEPAAGQWNMDAVAHYRAVIQALKQRGLEPVVLHESHHTERWLGRGGPPWPGLPPVASS
jgi:beta-glucosidase